MNSNEHPSAYGYQAPRRAFDYPLRPQVIEDTLKSGTVQIERKTFHFTLKENLRGRLLRITEETGGKRNSIIIPATGLLEFHQILAEMVHASAMPTLETPPPSPT